MITLNIQNSREWYDARWKPHETDAFNKWFEAAHGKPDDCGNNEELFVYWSGKGFALQGWITGQAFAVSEYCRVHETAKHMFE